jgi:aconitate decarboxylase
MVQAHVTRGLSEFVSSLRFGDLPRAVVQQAKRSILDTIGCGLHGSTLPWSQTLLCSVRRSGSSGPATAWGTGSTLSAPDAALVNGTFAHGFESDDVHQASYLHLGSVVLPAVLALAELYGSAVSGRDLIAAQVAGFEVGARLGLAGAKGMLARGFHPTAVVGAIASAAAASRLLGLDADGTQDAIGTAGSFASGLTGAQYGSSVKRMHAGLGSRSGVLSGLLAADGFYGIRDLFDLPHGGYLDAFASEVDRDVLLADLGTTWQTKQLGYKLYPACGASHTSIEAALVLATEEHINADDIERVLVRSTTHVASHVGWRYVPDTITTAQMNLPFAVASAFIDRRSSVDQFSEDRLAAPNVVALADRIRVQGDREADRRGPGFRNAIVMTVRLRNGAEFIRRVEQPNGSEQRPVSDEQLRAKFEALASHVFGGERIARLAAIISSLDSDRDVSALTAELAVNRDRPT